MGTEPRGGEPVGSPPSHICTADCWSYMLRYGMDENTEGCDPFAARAAADEALARFNEGERTMHAPYFLMIDRDLLSQRSEGQFQTLEDAKQAAQDWVVKTEAVTAEVISNATNETLVKYRKSEADA